MSSSGKGLSNMTAPTGWFFAAWSPSLALDHSGKPVVAWNVSAQSASGLWQQVYLRRWNGKEWVELGGSGSDNGLSNTIGFSRQPSLAIHSSGHPIVAWDVNTGGIVQGVTQIYLRRFTKGQ